MRNKAQIIFIADDDEDILHILQIMLRTQGYLVQGSTNPHTLFSLEELPDLVLLDIWMSGADGRDICQTFKKNPATSHIPVLFISANSGIEEIAVNSKADGYITKPFEMVELFTKVKSTLEKVQELQ